MNNNQDTMPEYEEETVDATATDATQDELLNDPLIAAQNELAEMKDKYLRALAEMQNIQRRAQRDVEDATKYSFTSAAKPFLDVAENLNRALDAIPQDAADTVKNLVEGIRATERGLQQALERMGVVAVKAEAGQKLDPHEHEVMFEVDTTDVGHGCIVQVLETGYKIHDRLLRPTRVSVAKNLSGNQGGTDNVVDVSA